MEIISITLNDECTTVTLSLLVSSQDNIKHDNIVTLDYRVAAKSNGERAWLFKYYYDKNGNKQGMSDIHRIKNERRMLTLDDFTIRHMIGEVDCSLHDLDIYSNLYLFLTNQIPEQDLRNNISKLFNKDA